VRDTDGDAYNRGFMHLACGLSVGLTGLAAGYAIGVVGDTVWLIATLCCGK
jgi:V-type H+-transporting ATPase proteolipid subunit